MTNEKAVEVAGRAAAALMLWAATFIYRHSAMGRTQRSK